MQIGRVVLSGDRLVVSVSQGIYRVIGNVTADAGQLIITAAEVTYDSRANMLFARGNVTVRGTDNITYNGNILQVDVATGTWQFSGWTVSFPPQFLGEPFIGPIFVGGENVTGFPDYHATATNTSVTTCNLPRPHYDVTCRVVEIYPGDKIIARDCELRVLGHRVLHLPFFFLTLRQNRSPIVPEVGQNTEEGYYLRLLYQYILNSNNVGNVRLDLTTKLGIGLGVNHFYRMPSGRGQAFLYARQGGKEIVARVDHKQRLPLGIDMAATVDVRRNSRFTIQPTTTTNITGLFSKQVGNNGWTLNLTRRLDESAFPVDNTTADFRYAAPLYGGRINASSTYSSFGRPNSGTSADQELWNRLTWARPTSLGTVNLRVDQRMDPDGDNYTNDNFSSALQRLPEVYLETNPGSLKWQALRRVPGTLTVGWGHFVENGGTFGGVPQQTDLDRYFFRWNAPLKPVRFARTTFTPTGLFQQTLYGDRDKTAQYTYNVGVTAQTQLGGLTNTVRYGKQNAYGFTPFRFDVTYPFHTLTDALQYRRGDRLQIDLTGGRDLQFKRWQDITLRADANVGAKFGMRLGVGYDPNGRTWRDLVNNFYWRDTPRLALSLGTRYDLEQNRLRQVFTEAQWAITPKWRVQWLGGYDGINKRFLHNEFLVTRDLHCWDASLYYSEQERSVYLLFRLKALNLQLPSFGIGRGGQPLGGTIPGTPF